MSLSPWIFRSVGLIFSSPYAAALLQIVKQNKLLLTKPHSTKDKMARHQARKVEKMEAQ